ncbi:MAG TPA: hypothetical protein VGO00_11140, partial [Kofleriaceae bacterium]|nr:hypothetical protein [Kofleriaceae bacterium]
MSVVAALLLAAAGSAYAQSQAQIANQLNEEGKELMFGNKYAEASAKFREAVARVPEPKYFFNLCTSLFQEGKFDLAITACNAVDKNTPAAELHDKNAKLIARIQEEAKAQNIELHPAGSGGGGGETNTTPPDPNGGTPPPDPNGGTPPADNGGPPPSQRPMAVGHPPPALFMAVHPDHHYTWSLGVDVFGGGGKIGQPDAYGSAFGGARVKGDYMIAPRSRVGAEFYLQFTHVGQGQMDSGAVDTLEIVDVGVALYKHFCLRAAERICLTPLIGVQLALLSPQGDVNSMPDANNQLFNYAAVGGRGELDFSWALGRRYEHVLSLMVGINAY